MKKEVRLGNYLVAFLDVLEQRDMLKQIRLPKTPHEKSEVLEILKQTAGTVLGLRSTFAQQFATFESGLKTLKKFTSDPIRPKFIGFSDSFVTSVPLHHDGKDIVPITTVYSALSASATVMICALATKHPLRGGIDVGPGIEIAPGETYGLATERAYVLESEEAKYPRILIGDGLWEYLNAARAEFQNSATAEGKAITEILDKIFEWIAVDTDNKRILDYLGPVMSNLQHSLGEFEDAIKLLYQFVLSERERVERLGCTKLIPRYDALRDYVESRLPLWGIEIHKS